LKTDIEKVSLQNSIIIQSNAHTYNKHLGTPFSSHLKKVLKLNIVLLNRKSRLHYCESTL